LTFLSQECLKVNRGSGSGWCHFLSPWSSLFGADYSNDVAVAFAVATGSLLVVVFHKCRRRKMNSMVTTISHSDNLKSVSTLLSMVDPFQTAF
jgi:hypothetical protein